MAALTLHCQADIRGTQNAQKVAFALTVDYDQSYAYLSGGEGFFGRGGVELPGIRVTPAQIALPQKEIGISIMEQANIDRTNGVIYVRLMDALTGNYRVLDGTCEPGAFVSPPRPAF